MSFCTVYLKNYEHLCKYIHCTCTCMFVLLALTTLVYSVICQRLLSRERDSLNYYVLNLTNVVIN